jgi:hypothetical protein
MPGRRPVHPGPGRLTPSLRVHVKPLIFNLLLAFVFASLAAGQNTKYEFWPELDIYAHHGSRIRIVFVDSMNQDQSNRNGEGAFSYSFELAMQPVFRRELRQLDDIFRRRFLTFRAGYQYTTSFVSGDPSSEHRLIAETTARYPLPKKFVALDRNRGEFRFIKGQPYSMRYRNRLWLERDFKLAGLVFTPYIFDEIFYDTRYSAWTTNQATIGLQIPAGPHVVLEPYFCRQQDRRASQKYVNATGFTLNLYF